MRLKRVLFFLSFVLIVGTFGYEYGRSTGYDLGFASGNESGYSAGYDAGIIDGKKSGYQEGYSDGKTDGYDSGYAAGQSVSKSYSYSTYAAAPSYQVSSNNDASPSIGTTVYITKTGKKYHRSSCSSLSKSKIETTVFSAKLQGYTACSKCKPPS